MVPRRHERIHLQNHRISLGARRHHFDERIGVPFLCECDDEQCHEFVVLTLLEFERVAKSRFVIVGTGHLVAGGVHAGRGDGYELYRTNSTQLAAG